MRRNSYVRNMPRRRRLRDVSRSHSARGSRSSSNMFERDLIAMAMVWRMLKEGTLKAFGEIGRQY